MPKLLFQIIISLVVLVYSVYVKAQEITLYIIPPPVKINWNSPQKLLISFLQNEMAKNRSGTSKHAIGHVVVALKNGKRYAVVGMAPISRSAMCRKVKKEGYGFGGLCIGFPGKLEGTEINGPGIQKRMESGELAYVRIKVNEGVFNRLWEYMEEYKRRGYDAIYNGKNLPRQGEGAGCSAFALSFLEVGELPLKAITENWKISVPVPLQLIGGEQGGGKRVPLLRIFVTNRWADKEKEPYQEISYYDPDRMFEWVTAAYNRQNSMSFWKREMQGKAKGIAFDCTSAPIPTTSIFLTPSEIHHHSAGKSITTVMD